MLYVTLNLKGGAGKSTISAHLLPEHILKKQPEETVSLFEFDEYSQTTEDYLAKSKIISSKVIKERDIADEIFEAVLESKDGDFIVDVGTGALSKTIASLGKREFDTNNTVFLIPYSLDGISALFNTIDLLEQTFDNPKILVVLNRVEEDIQTLEDAKKSVFELYGSEKWGFPKHERLQDVDKYIKAFIPENKLSFRLARLEKRSLIDMKKEFETTKDMDDETLYSYWHTMGLIKDKKPTKEEFKALKIINRRYREAYDFIESCSIFYETLREIDA